MAVATIEGELRRHHPREVRVRRDWTTLDRYALVFDVEYTGADGRRRRNRCTVYAADDAAVHWDDPL
jgi:hypothetical protein